MANNENVETSNKWYCHTCEAVVVPSLPVSIELTGVNV